MKNFYSQTHEITPFTMAILAHQDVKGSSVTRILEEDTEYVINASPTKVIDHACRYFGASLKGRQEGTREISGITHKAPISIDPTSGMYFFPTSSPSNPHCSWLAHSHIDKVARASNNQTEVAFKNEKKIILKVSYGSVLNQLQRTAQFRFLLDKRIRFLYEYQPDIVAEP